MKKAAFYYLGSLYAFLKENRQQQVDKLKRNGAIDNDGRAVDVKHLRGNILHDTMFLILSQLVAIDEYFSCTTKDEGVSKSITAIGGESFKTISCMAAVACHYADMYFGTPVSSHCPPSLTTSAEATYNTIERISRGQCEYLKASHGKLLRQRAKILYARDGLGESPPETITELATALVNHALTEVRDPKAPSDWEKLSYTSLLFCFRHEHAQVACEAIISVRLSVYVWASVANLSKSATAGHQVLLHAMRLVVCSHTW